MPAQIITTEGGEEIVILSRLAYDALLARAGDEAAEQRMTARMAEDHIAAKAAGRAEMLPDWLSAAIIDGVNPIKAGRLTVGLTQAALARAAGLSQAYLSDLESGRRLGTVESVRKLAPFIGCDNPDWLLDADAPVEPPPAIEQARRRVRRAMRARPLP